MIPFVYRLRERVRLERDGNGFLVISEIPLHLIRVSERAARVALLCDGVSTVSAIAEKLRLPDEQVYRVCQYFLKKGILGIEPLREGDWAPSVTVIIPVKDRKEQLRQCLMSVFSQDYPEEKLEVIVVDDGSLDGTADLARMFPCRVMSHAVTRGQSYCRNVAAREAKGEILAFIDSDCVAGESWLKELIPYFQWERIGAVGGFVDGYYEGSALDRYEKTCSPLNMGRRVLFGEGDDSTFYTPTCNLLVRASAYRETGGIREELHVGEDVDLCWRMRKKGYCLLYVPQGSIWHKHRNSLIGMLKRRADYGTSEAILYTLHGEKKKVFPLPLLSALTFLSLILSLLFLSPLLLVPAFVSLVIDGALKMRRVAGYGHAVAPWKVFASAARSQFSFLYFLSFHLVRYYLLLFIIAAGVFPLAGVLGLFMALLSSSVDYMTKKPRISYPSFFLFSSLEHLFYQTGVLVGCVKAGTFRSYAPRLVKRDAWC